jgi:hypothetical protein
MGQVASGVASKGYHGIIVVQHQEKFRQNRIIFT